MKFASLLFPAILFLTSGIQAQTNFWYEGQVEKSKGTCMWLIRITDTNDSSFRGKLIEPTGDFPESFQHRRTKLRFEMHPLRQPVPHGCKAHVVASIVNAEKL